MSIKNIKDIIQKEIQSKITAVESKTTDEIRQIRLSAVNEVEALKEEIKAKTEEKIDRLKKQFLTTSDSKKRSLILGIKQELMSEAREKAYKYLDSLNGDDYQKLITSLLAKINLMDEKAEMIVPETKEAESKKALKASGHKFDLVVDKKLKNGFIIKDKYSEINNSFAEVVDFIFEDQEMKIIEMLF
jgi:vacuolar-type H+-ATPase subunit E/Vma4